MKIFNEETLKNLLQQSQELDEKVSNCVTRVSEIVDECTVGCYMTKASDAMIEANLKLIEALDYLALSHLSNSMEDIDNLTEIIQVVASTRLALQKAQGLFPDT